jgi:hypothetical protein
MTATSLRLAQRLTHFQQLIIKQIAQCLRIGNKHPNSVYRLLAKTTERTKMPHINWNGGVDMAKLTIQPGDEITAQVHEDMQKRFTGRVMKNYEHSAMLEITEFDRTVDGPNVPELNGRIVVSFKNMTAINGKPVKAKDEISPAPKPEDELPEKKRT